MCIEKIKEWLRNWLEEPEEPIEPPVEPITYLVVKDGKRASVWPYVDAGEKLDDYLRAGDAVPVRNVLYDWHEVVLTAFPRFLPFTIGWVKFDSEKMYLEDR